MTAGEPVQAATWVGTSWKMTKTLADAVAYAQVLREQSPDRWDGVQPFVIPPATALTTVRATLGPDSPVLLGAQNAHWEDAGAWTGELSVPQVKDAGAQLVEIGHSERREHFAETDRTVNQKVRAALRHDVVPLVCVGEPGAVFDEGGSVPHVRAQVRAALEGVTDLGRVLLAYEPVWAIGERGRPAEPEDVADVFTALRADVPGVPLLYGGSVSSANAADLLALPEVDGLFVGRSAWTVEGFLDIVDIARRSRPQPSATSTAHEEDGQR